MAQMKALDEFITTQKKLKTYFDGSFWKNEM
jgi:hypothetical protein